MAAILRSQHPNSSAALAPLDAPPAAAMHAPSVYLASLAAGGGRRSQRAALDTFAAAATGGACDALSLPWAAVRYSHVMAVRTIWTGAGLAPSTINARLSAVRGAMRHAWMLGDIPTEHWERIRAVPSVRGSRLAAGRALDSGEIHALMAACADGTAIGARDTALVAVLYGAGIRRAECAALMLADYHAHDSAVRVLGKGNRERLAYLPAGAVIALDRWLAMRQDRPGPLLCQIGRGGRIYRRRPLSGTAIDARIKRRAAAAGIPALSPHDLRRTHASAALDGGADIAAVARQLGHASIQTTARYDRRPDRAQAAAAARIHVPVIDHAAG